MRPMPRTSPMLGTSLQGLEALAQARALTCAHCRRPFFSMTSMVARRRGVLETGLPPKVEMVSALKRVGHGRRARWWRRWACRWRCPWRRS